MKKDKRKLYNTSKGETTDIYNVLKVLGGVVAFFLIVYFGYAIFTGEISFGGKKDEETEAIIQDVEILAGTTFSRDKEEYMVLFYDQSDDNLVIFNTLYSRYNEEANHLKLYIVDLSNKFNESYLAKEEEKVNTNPKDASELKISGPTLIRIKDKKVTKYVSGIQNIKDYISTLLSAD